MSQDVIKWLNEIKNLQEKLAYMQEDRDAALATATQWRQLYNTEAEQRRNDQQQSQQAIAQLNQQLEALQNPAQSHQSVKADTIRQEIASIDDLAVLKTKLSEALQECDRLASELKVLKEKLQQEQLNHENTRHSLTMALGDAIDLLSNK